jgi:branched-chain amino acid transport system permease protein
MTRQRIAIIAGIVIAILLLIAAPYVLSDFYLSTLDEIFIYGLFAVSINLLMGYTGLFTLGHAALFGIGAYTCAYLTSTLSVPFVPSFLSGIAFAMLVSIPFGLLAIRTTGIYFIMITIAENMLVYGLAFRLYNLTGAENGLSGVVRPNVFQADWQYFYFSAAVVIIALFLAWRLVRSPFGLTLKGIRESETRMRTLGYNVTLHKLISFTLAGTLAGLAGCLYAFYSTYVSVTVVDFSQSSAGFLMVIIGGVGTFFGPLLGSAILTILQEWVSLYTDRWQIVMGTVLILTILFARDGILGIASQLMSRRLHTAKSQPRTDDVEDAQAKILITQKSTQKPEKSALADRSDTATN